jgi:adenylosuccinate synthase
MLLNTVEDFNIVIALRILTGEYGTGSGRTRLIGILDVGQLSQAVALHGIDEIFLNKIDCLTHFSHTPESVIPIHFGDSPDRTIENFLPFSISNEPLPPELLRLLQLVELKTECKIRGIGTGQRRNDFFLFDSLSTHIPSHHDS